MRSEAMECIREYHREQGWGPDVWLARSRQTGFHINKLSGAALATATARGGWLTVDFFSWASGRKTTHHVYRYPTSKQETK
ncbi:hypothetical protein PLICRDRAFT_181162 [Plicaturopsis crispa FD-325 SS-3]|uniref:Uncharacterized protein n=1 Tax=Plicaturopsis crispa FD-325 SS-3 TaxID=944288 RepID=A0A0C9T3M5_PLICR|nr:hypothetical protein PLICRDRAFT_181162 [Plicaturopsis crispa FD-325 SS-3]